jgi:WD40 repeat protein
MPSQNRYPIDLISDGSSKFSTSDINNQIKVWSLNNDEEININLSDLNQTAIWSMCLTKDDKYLFVGQSNGELKVFNILNSSKFSIIFNQF